MIPFAIAAAGIVMITATCISWIYNQKTEDEKLKQKELLSEQEVLRNRFRQTFSDNTEAKRKIQIETADQFRQLLLKVIQENESKLGDIDSGLIEIFKIVSKEISDSAVSPYRKAALRRDFCRFEDAQARLNAYRTYLNSERNRIEKEWALKKYDELLEIEPTESLLPPEWLYIGKVVLVSLTEINKDLPKFSHKISFGKKDFSRHQSLAIEYLNSEQGDEFPVLIKRQHENYPHIFYGCVARGLLYYNHIIPNKPVQMEVEKSFEHGFNGTLFAGLIKVYLPKAKINHRFLTKIDGQLLDVYPDTYDMTLSYNPVEGKHRPIEVSEIEPAKLGKMDSKQLYLFINDYLLEPIKDEDFYTVATRWTLVRYDYDTQQIILGKSNVTVTCEASKDVTSLKVISVEQKQTFQSGFDIPFELILASDSLYSELHNLGWHEAVKAFLNFVGQISINEKDSINRQQQAKFFKQWQDVLDYQQQVESESIEEFQAIIESNSIIVNIQNRDSENGEVISSIERFNDIEKNNNLDINRCCQLFVWNTEKQLFSPAFVKGHRNKPAFQLVDNVSLKITGEFYKQSKDKQQLPSLFKFIIREPNIPLQRQRQALEALANDRLVEARLKDIFLSPSCYQPEYNSYWENQDIRWQSNLSKSQKLVVETALRAKHVALVQGPPGTGKTTVIVEILYQLLSANPNQRILVVSQQNTAVDNAISRFVDKNEEFVKNSVQIVRIGYEDKMDSEVVKYSFDAVHRNFMNDLQQKAEITATTCSNDNVRNLTYRWRALLQEIQVNSRDIATNNELFATLLSDKNLIGATCVGLAGRKGGMDNLDFDVAIIDEAGRATVPELLIPLLRCRKAILIGDHFQLPPSIAALLREDEAIEKFPFIKDAFLETSFFEMLFDSLPAKNKAILNEQFRMSLPIGDLVGDLFYSPNGERTLSNGNVQDDRSNFLLQDCVNWFNVTGKQNRVGTSLENDVEAREIADFILKLSELTNINKKSVAIITPYSAQKQKIKLYLKRIPNCAGENEFKLGNLSIKVDTVDAFQGSEAEIVCYSTVRTHGSLQFLLDKKRLNVACSRAKENLIFFGNAAYLIKKDKGNLFTEIYKRAQTLPHLTDNFEAFYKG